MRPLGLPSGRPAALATLLAVSVAHGARLGTGLRSGRSSTEGSTAGIAAWAPSDNAVAGEEILLIPQGLQVGRSRGGADVVADGLVKQSWSPTSPKIVTPSEVRTRLFAQFAPSSIAGPPALQVAELATTSQDPSVATAWVERSGGSGQGLSVGSDSEPLVLDVVYDCHRAGVVGLALTYRFDDPRLAPVELHAIKECSPRARHGLFVGTSVDADGNVVRDGVSRWAPATAVQRIVPSRIQRLSFFLSLQPASGADDTALQVLDAPRLSVTTLGSRGLLAEAPPASDLQRWQRQLLRRAHEAARQRRAGRWGLLQGSTSQQSPEEEVLRVRQAPASPRQAALGARPLELELHFDCLAPGAALVELEVAPVPMYQPYRPVIVAFVKQCGGIARQGFDIATRPLGLPRAAGRQHASSLLATRSVDADLVRDGAIAGRLPDVGNVEDSLLVYWRDRRRDLGPPTRSQVACGLDAPAGAVLGPVTVDDSAGHSGSQEIRLLCKRPGVARCNLQLGWRLHQGPSLRFLKVCGGVRRDIKVESDLARAPTVLLHGQTVPEWGRAPEVEISPLESALTFIVSPGERPMRLREPSVAVSNPEVVQAELASDIVDGAEVSNRSNGTGLALDLRCLGNGTSRIEVTLPFGAGEIFRPMSFAFTKRCAGAEGGSWLPSWAVGVVVVLLLTFAVAGTLFGLWYSKKKRAREVEADDDIMRWTSMLTGMVPAADPYDDDSVPPEPSRPGPLDASTAVQLPPAPPVEPGDGGSLTPPPTLPGASSGEMRQHPSGGLGFAGGHGAGGAQRRPPADVRSVPAASGSQPADDHGRQTLSTSSDLGLA